MSLGVFEIIGLLAVAATTGFLVVMSVTWDDTFGRGDDRPDPVVADQPSTVATERTADSTAATVSNRN